VFLKSLELNGFKSFASKTVLEFPCGITAIVGPNGAGKSNVIDAIRWLLGEREAKNLRSAKAEDLIFNGTPKKARLSLAQAVLYFDNNSGFFPIDFKEVAISRRVGRDGVSQYFLNKAEVRLKDIIDFFSRSRLGTKGMIIISQGDSDVFVRATAEERKIMIEEILGLREYQLKKNEAEKKLTHTFFNLEKVKAMVSEVVPRLRMLKRQTNKWSKRVEIQEELDKLENGYFSYKLKEIKNAEAEIEPNLISLNKEINEKRKELNVLESELKKIESQAKEYSEIKKIKSRQQELLSQRSQIEKELGRLEAKLEIIASSKNKNFEHFENNDLFNLINETKEILEKSLSHSDLEALKNVVKQLLHKISDFLEPSKTKNLKSEEMRELEGLKNNLSKKFDVLEKELNELGRQEILITEKLEAFNKNFQKTFEFAQSKRKELSVLEEKKNKIILEKEKLNFKFEDLENQLRQIGKTMKDFSNINESLNFSILQSFNEPEIERKIFKLRSELSAIGEIDPSLVKEAQETETHYNFLTSQSNDLDKAIVDLKNLIKELNDKIHFEFNSSLRLINEEFNKFFRLMFQGGTAKLRIKNYVFAHGKSPEDLLRIRNNGQNDDENQNDENNKNSEVEKNEEKEIKSGVEIDLSLPKRRKASLEMLSGGEKSLVSIAALFSLISISPPPFLVLDETDAALDESNSKRFADLIKEFSRKTQFIIVTHNRALMEAADVLYGITLGEEGTSKILSLKLE